MKHYRKRKLDINNLVSKKPEREQLKLHVSQMSKFDVERLAYGIRRLDLDKLTLSQHVINKGDITLTRKKVITGIKKNFGILEKCIVEYNIIPVTVNEEVIMDKRVLIRDNYDFDGKNLCFVLSLNRNTIVTAYWIEKDFTHEKTINWDRYKQNVYISIK